MDDAARDHDLIGTQAEAAGAARRRDRGASRRWRAEAAISRCSRACAATKRSRAATGAAPTPRMRRRSATRPTTSTRCRPRPTRRRARRRRARRGAATSAIAELAPSALRASSRSARAGESRRRRRRGSASFDQALDARRRKPGGRSRGRTCTTAAWKRSYRRPAQARAAFARARRRGGSGYRPAIRAHAWYVEQAQEGTIALGVRARRAAALSLAPWTGADLPGSIASTIKYRLVGQRRRGAKLVLAVGGLAAAVDRLVLHRPRLRAVPHVGRRCRATASRSSSSKSFRSTAHAARSRSRVDARGGGRARRQRRRRRSV